MCARTFAEIDGWIPKHDKRERPLGAAGLRKGTSAHRKPISLRCRAVSLSCRHPPCRHHSSCSEHVHRSVGEVRSFDEVAVELMGHQSLYSRDPDTTRYNLVVLGRHFGGRFIHEIDGAAVESFVQARKGEGRSNGTINRQMATLSGAMKLAIRRGWHPGPNPVRQMGILREAQPRTPYYTQAEMQKLINAAALHLKPVITAALWTMARRRELLTLQWPHVQLDRRFVAFQQGNTKARKERLVPMNEGLHDMFVWLGPRRDGYVFLYNGKPIRQVKTSFLAARRKAGIPGVSFRDLRHVGSCWFMENGGKLEELQVILGHSELSLTQRYGRFSKGYLGTLADRIGPPSFRERNF